jgi:hypothetical protein
MDSEMTELHEILDRFYDDLDETSRSDLARLVREYAVEVHQSRVDAERESTVKLEDVVKWMIVKSHTIRFRDLETLIAEFKSDWNLDDAKKWIGVTRIMGQPDAIGDGPTNFEGWRWCEMCGWSIAPSEITDGRCPGNHAIS